MTILKKTIDISALKRMENRSLCSVIFMVLNSQIHNRKEGIVEKEKIKENVRHC
jgi:hypothetical protein